MSPAIVAGGVNITCVRSASSGACPLPAAWEMCSASPSASLSLVSTSSATVSLPATTVYESSEAVGGVLPVVFGSTPTSTWPIARSPLASTTT